MLSNRQTSPNHAHGEAPKWILAALLAMLAGILLNSVLGRFGSPDSPAQVRPVAARDDLADDEKTTISLFEAASPSVVHITTLEVRRRAFSFNVMEIPHGTGSGIVWDTKGHIVTNYHVLQGANAARVTLSDQTIWEASLVGTEPDKDLAVLRIQAPSDRLQPIVPGTSEDLRVGQKVLAIGNPFGLDQTLTTGVISGLDREIESVTKRPISGVIQTDAAINPGNSGGPLLDSAGRLIGVNTAIFSPSGVYAGIGFAVPVDTVNRIVPQLVKYGKVRNPGLGIQVAPEHITHRMGVSGLLVMSIMRGGPADKAGMRVTMRDQSGRIILGDIIVGLGGKKIESVNDLYRALDTHEVGNTVVVTIRRDKELMDLKVVLEAQ